MKSTSPEETEEDEERAAGFVLFRRVQAGRRYLLLRHCSDGHWGFPKGRIEPGEDDLAAAVREVFEETRIDELKPVPGFRQTSRYRFRRHGQPVSKTAVYYLAEAPTDPVRLSAEHDAFRWLTLSDAIDVLTHHDSQRILRRADAWLAQPSASTT